MLLFIGGNGKEQRANNRWRKFENNHNTWSLL